MGANNTALTANFITTSITTGNVVLASGDLDFFKFTAPAGASVVVIMDDDPDDDLSLTDTDLFIIDTDGTTILATGDNESGHRGNAAGSVTVAAAGTYFVRVGNGNFANDSEYRFVLLVNGVVYSDGDGDGVPDTDDNCPAFFNPAQADGDGDGFGDACDGCPADVLKQAPGACGCAQPDVDFNGNGVIDCGLADPARTMLAGVGLLLVADATNHRVMAFDPADGDLIDPNFIPSDPANLPGPFAAILGPDHTSVLVSDSVNDLVQRYDLNGNFLGTFAPAGGVNLAIMDTPAGIALRPSGNLLVCVTAGANANTIAGFNSAGNYIGNFFPNGSGGLVDPIDVYFRANGHVLVSGEGSSAIHEYAATGAFIANFAVGTVGSDAPTQIIEAANSHVFAAVRGFHRGVAEYLSNGTYVARHSPPSVDGFRGVFELGNGHLLITTTYRIGVGSGPVGGQLFGGVFEMDRNGNILETKINGLGGLALIEFVLQDTDGDGVGDNLDGCPNDPAKIAPGQCGCGALDTDGDGDGVADCVDGCPGDPAKIIPGLCGCGVPDADSDGDGIPDCVDNCPDVPNLDQADSNGDGVGDACTTPPASQPTNVCCGAGSPMIIPLTVLGLMAVRTTVRRRRQR
jgi:hypothetical protein